MRAIEHSSDSVAATLALGRRLAGLLRPGDVVLLSGRLGAGKTVFVAGVAEGLGVEELVTSPSFVLVSNYTGFMPVVHADAYRIGSIGEYHDLELEDLAGDGVLLIEWGDAVAAAVNPNHLVVRIEIDGEATRRIWFNPMGSWTTRQLEELGA